MAHSKQCLHAAIDVSGLAQQRVLHSNLQDIYAVGWQPNGIGISQYMYQYILIDCCRSGLAGLDQSCCLRRGRRERASERDSYLRRGARMTGECVMCFCHSGGRWIRPQPGSRDALMGLRGAPRRSPPTHPVYSLARRKRADRAGSSELAAPACCLHRG
eukprot:363200-Chlamydomonas_euryale.AAC.6